MAAQSVQVSLPEALLREIDRRPETRKQGRSAVIQQALRLYLEHVRREETDRAYERAYGGRADEVFDELGPLIKGQRWPAK
jgi:metal-responsive CopG/Arc/MetJ family transcriptional regulator